MQKAGFWLAYLLVRVLVWLYHRTCRTEIIGPIGDYLKEGRPFLVACWHQDMFFNFAYLVKAISGRPLATIISQSKDGALAAFVMEKLGAQVLRGSSSRGGKAALDAIVANIRTTGAIGMLVCDGPKPPARTAKIGIALLARRTGLPVIPLRSWSAWGFTFRKSWCRFYMVCPFSRAGLWSAPPMSISSQATLAEAAAYRLQIERTLNLMADQSERYFKGAMP